MPSSSPARDDALRQAAFAHVEQLPPSRLKTALEAGLLALGTPYVWGGDDPVADGGFDCAGLAYRLYHDSGLAFPRPRFSSLNMTDRERSDLIPKVWWTSYAPEFAQTMTTCQDRPLKDGDVLVYHALKGGKIIDRTGHVVIALDASAGTGLSAARGGVRLHALGDFRRYGDRERTGCWRTADAGKAPYARPVLRWTFPGQTTDGSIRAPFVLAPPLKLTVEVDGPGVKTAAVEVLGRVLAYTGFVSPLVEDLPAPANQRILRLSHDFRAADLPSDPGYVIDTPLRRLVIRLLDADGLIEGEKVVYVHFKPYWH